MLYTQLFRAVFVFSVVTIVFGNLTVTSPSASAVLSGGNSSSTITWVDNGSPPSLKTFGPSTVTLCIGDTVKQTVLQTISSSTDVSTSSKIVFTVDPKIGPNGSQYFIRFQSIKSPTIVSFSAKFTLTNMTGTTSTTSTKTSSSNSRSSTNSQSSRSSSSASSTLTSHASSTSSLNSTASLTTNVTAPSQTPCLTCVNVTVIIVISDAPSPTAATTRKASGEISIIHGSIYIGKLVGLCLVFVTSFALLS